jgi:hypothetical protein
MFILNGLGDFLISEWLWSMTFAWSYLIVGVFTSWFLLRHIMSLTMLRSCVLAVLVNLFSFLLYSALIAGFFMYLLQWWYVPHEYQVTTGPFVANMYLAAIYTIFHSIFFYGLHRLCDAPKMRLLLVALLSNSLAALISYFYIVIVYKNCL